PALPSLVGDEAADASRWFRQAQRLQRRIAAQRVGCRRLAEAAALLQQRLLQDGKPAEQPVALRNDLLALLREGLPLALRRLPARLVLHRLVGRVLELGLELMQTAAELGALLLGLIEVRLRHVEAAAHMRKLRRLGGERRFGALEALLRAVP